MHYKLIATRKKADDSQENLANLVGCTRLTFGKKERMESGFTLQEAEKLARHYEMTIEELFEDVSEIGIIAD